MRKYYVKFWMEKRKYMTKSSASGEEISYYRDEKVEADESIGGPTSAV